MDLFEHHFFFAGVLVSNFENAEPEILRKGFSTILVKITDTGVTTMTIF